MCDVCHQTPHNNRCPYAPDPKFVGMCETCGGQIREDYIYYVDHQNNKFCSNKCADKYYGIRTQE